MFLPFSRFISNVSLRLGALRRESLRQDCLKLINRGARWKRKETRKYLYENFDRRTRALDTRNVSARMVGRKDATFGFNIRRKRTQERGREKERV